MSHRAWAEINLKNFKDNVLSIKSHINTGYLCVIKANAYGHGDTEIARAAESLDVDYFGIATIDEAIALRKSGITKPILIFGYTCPSDIELLIQYSITQGIYSLEYAELLSNYAEKFSLKPNCHIKLDTGMNRLGFCAKNIENFLEKIYKLSHRLNITGAFTHLAVADENTPESLKFTLNQIQLFNSACDQLISSGVELKIRHYANSAQALLGGAIPLGDMVRIGIAQYGLSPFSDEKLLTVKLKPVMSLYATVAMVKYIEAGESVSYGRSYIAHKKMKVATITIGYGDGYPRSLSGKGSVIINGKRAYIIGKVCMDQLIVDVSEIDSIKIGDIATIVGTDGTESITFNDLARLTGTIHYEMVCAISPRVCREYIL